MTCLEFEKNHQIYGNCIAKQFAKLVIIDLENDYICSDYLVAPQASDPEMWSLDLDITKRTGLAALKSFTEPCQYLQPFFSWTEKFSNVSHINETVPEYYQDKMVRIGSVAEKKLKTLLYGYCSHPMRSTFRFDIEFNKTNLELQVKFWIDHGKLIHYAKL